MYLYTGELQIKDKLIKVIGQEDISARISILS